MTGGPPSRGSLPSVAAIAAGVRTGEVDVRDLVEQCLRRIGRLEPRLAVWSHLDADDVRRQADTLARDHGDGRLAGVPIGVKDVVDVRGVPTGAGYPPLSRTPATRDAVVVARLRAAGAIIVGKQATAQFAFQDPAPTRNPRDSKRTPGGSTSGGAVAVATGQVAVAVGTQTGGSLLRPAAYNGVIGYKPSATLLSTVGVLHLAPTVDQLGVLARTVADARHAVESMASRELAVSIAGTASPRVGILDDLLDEASNDLPPLIRRQADRLALAGAEVFEVRVPGLFDELRRAHRVITEAEAAAVHGHRLVDGVANIGPRFRELLKRGASVSREEYERAQQRRSRLAAALLDHLVGLDLLVAPVVPGPPPERSTTGPASMLSPLTLLGWPTLALPTSDILDGHPTAVQLVARPAGDAQLLEIAEHWERVLGPAPWS